MLIGRPFLHLTSQPRHVDDYQPNLASCNRPSMTNTNSIRPLDMASGYRETNPALDLQPYAQPVHRGAGVEPG